jgi:hypothetical protein
LSNKYFGHIWVEDNIENAEAGYTCGYRSVLMSHGYNYDYVNPNIPMVLNWEQLYHEIIQPTNN